MHILALDPEMEYEDLTLNLGGCFIDLMSGEFIINVLEPKSWDEQTEPVLNPHAKTSPDQSADDGGFVPEAFRKSSKLSQHISFLKDFFRAYKDFTDREIDTIEIMVTYNAI